MSIDLIFITYNRLSYTKLALPALLADPTEEFSLTIWDNASVDDTKEYLSSVDDPRITRKVFARENVRLHGATNDLISKSKADLIGIIPGDFLVTPGWTRPLVQAHAEVPEFGMVGCWHLSPEEFDYERAKNKIQTFGKHQILRHPWTGGGAGLVKLKTIRECGALESSATTQYWLRMAMKGYVNGYYYPLIYVEHMDYPWSKYYAFAGRFEEGLELNATSKSHGISSVEDTMAWHKVVMKNILDDPWQAEYYVGWRAKLRRIKNKVKRTFLGMLGLLEGEPAAQSSSRGGRDDAGSEALVRSDPDELSIHGPWGREVIVGAAHP